MRSCLWSLAVFFIFLIAETAAVESDSIWPRLRTSTNPRKSNKPKKYKCILVDDEDSDEALGAGANAGASYISELQQRRVQATNTQPRSGPEANWSQQAAAIRPQMARTLTYERTIEDKTRSLKQITLNRPPVAPARTQLPAENTNFRAPNPPVAPVTFVTPPPNMQLDPQYCNMIKQYAGLYQVVDVVAWVHKNCAFAKMYLPNATCEEIDLLVASCYR
ncbi:hypothetical protein M3Y94_00806900 [Aphelenchoides besseyi]|nr:hypothetical protein M3Y94_00806900 [Aphelenchoides besseyi]KAI6227244.1 hypothetical protein M3Y95_00706200 [Aphelenchoides besseyi]